MNRAIRRHVTELAPELTRLARAPDAAGREKAAEALPPLLGSVVAADTAWACTTCGWGETACPVFIENVPRLVDLRRHQVLVESAFPEEAARVIKNLETQGNPWGIGSNRRADWCQDLDVPRAADGNFEWLFFVGCAGSFDERNRAVVRATCELFDRAGLDYAVLGSEEGCCGDPARRSGNEALYYELATANVEVLNEFVADGSKRIVTTCPHCPAPLQYLRKLATGRNNHEKQILSFQPLFQQLCDLFHPVVLCADHAVPLPVHADDFIQNSGGHIPLPAAHAAEGPGHDHSGRV